MSELETFSTRVMQLESKIAELESIRSIEGTLRKIDRDLRDLYSAVCVADFKNAHEDGYVSECEVDHGWRKVMPGYRLRYYVPKKSDQEERISALQELSSIAQHLEVIGEKLDEETRTGSDGRTRRYSAGELSEIDLHLDGFHKDLRHRLFEVDNCRIRFWKWTLNELSFCIRCIFIASCETVDYVSNKYRAS